MSKNKDNKKDWNDKYRLVPDDIVKNLVEFLDEIQFEAAKEGTSDGIQVINICNYLIGQLINSIEAHPYKRYDRTDRINDHIIEFSDMSDKEFKKFVDNFEAFFKGWDREYKKTNRKNKSKHKKNNLDKLSEYMSLKEIKEFLIDDPELTNYERFELYYDEHRRVQKQKQKKKEEKNSVTYDEMMKELGILPSGENKNGKNNK